VTIMQAAASAAGRGSPYNLDGHTVTHSVSNGSTAEAGVRLNADGTVDQNVGGTYSQIDAVTGDWRNGLPENGEYARFTRTLGDSSDFTGTLGSWTAISTNPEIFYQHANNDTERDGTYTIEIATDSGGTNIVASGSYLLSAIVGIPT